VNRNEVDGYEKIDTVEDPLQLAAGGSKKPRARMTSTDPIEPTEGYLAVPGGRLHFLDWGGAGHPAHFLHGNGFCAGTYAPFIRHLAGKLHITASDIRGHSGSEFETLERIRDWRVFAEDLNTLIRGIQAPPVIGMGHSLGAVATTIAAASYPDLFKAIILIDPVFLPSRTLWKAAGMRFLGLAGAWPRAVRARKRRRVFNGKADAFRYFVARGIFKSWSPEFVQAYLECGLLEKDEQTAVLRCDPELEAQIFESVPLDVWSQCRKISCPVLAVRGEQSDVFLKEAAVRLARTAVDCEVVTIPDCGHFLTMEKPQPCAQVIRDYVSRRLRA
jgi:pimeloyl-ACP methyl ester carboxylesterase